MLVITLNRVYQLLIKYIHLCSHKVCNIEGHYCYSVLSQFTQPHPFQPYPTSIVIKTFQVFKNALCVTDSVFQSQTFSNTNKSGRGVKWTHGSCSHRLPSSRGIKLFQDFRRLVITLVFKPQTTFPTSKWHPFPHPNGNSGQMDHLGVALAYSSGDETFLRRLITRCVVELQTTFAPIKFKELWNVPLGSRLLPEDARRSTNRWVIWMYFLNTAITPLNCDSSLENSYQIFEDLTVCTLYGY